MAGTAAHVQIAIKMKRSKLLEGIQSELKLNVVQRKTLLKQLESFRNTRFLTELCAGALLVELAIEG
jgi:hypothetical protein